MNHLSVVTIALLILLTSPYAMASEKPNRFSATRVGTQKSSRAIVIISDLHFGPGRINGGWHPFEDFQWPNALRGFLDAIGKRFQDAVDLVIAGDLFELWQHPKMHCTGCGDDLRCTDKEIEDITKEVIKAHTDELHLFGNFADRGTNRVFIIPGNHDAALLLDNVWFEVRKAMRSATLRVFRADKGVWASESGMVVVEHGQQIGLDANRFKSWPTITRKCSRDGKDYLERPWGEGFVEKLYNPVESAYPVIDNLIPESAGIALYSKRQQVIENAADVARFIMFNIFQTSLRQKIELNMGDPTKADAWDVGLARARGYRLFADALAPADPFRAELLGSQEQRFVQIRKEFDELAANPVELPDNTIQALCDQIKIRALGSTEANIQLCSRDLLLSAARSLFPRSRILGPYLADLVNRYPNMSIFVYGHTHQADFDITIKATPTKSIAVLNTGAFQRLLDEESFLQRAAAAEPLLKPEQALKEFTLEKNFPPCYSAVLVSHDLDDIPQARLEHWMMSETDSTGQFVGACDPKCGARPPRCQAK
jgi:UDP-2,3-diacylglucosamine pyrophosphatase LpxH